MRPSIQVSRTEQQCQQQPCPQQLQGGCPRADRPLCWCGEVLLPVPLQAGDRGTRGWSAVRLAHHRVTYCNDWTGLLRIVLRIVASRWMMLVLGGLFINIATMNEQTKLK